MREQDRVCHLLERERALRARERTRALVTIADDVIARYGAEKDRRGLLDYDDLIDKTLTLFARASRRLGALQARPRHRPRADRRGAGHQPEAMGDHRAPSSPSSRPAARARTSSARCSRSATRSSRSSRSRARRRQPSTRCAACSRASSTRRSWAGAICVSTIRSAPATTCSARSTRCSSARELYASVTTDEAGVPPHINRCPMPRRDWSRSGR